ncbi:adenosylcobinamide-GDP ribazoletransferase [Nonomuraea sp. NPDC050328]|uniref:adenosylcobinamide-GDP ribazoletransferase n=1 Tax=Nonomuraea sp. NPDC050328 TaxID=3364361 RepID=UPI0037A65F44
MSWVDGAKFAVGTLSIFRVHVTRVDREVVGQAMTLAPVVGIALGLIAAIPLLLSPGLLGAVLALAVLAYLTRALHLDGLADLADGLGSAKPAPQALDIMKRSDIGPFGVATLIFTVLAQTAALAGLPPAASVAALITATLTGRLALTWACRSGVPSARPDGLGAMVAGTVRRSTPYLVTLLALAFAALLAVTSVTFLALEGTTPAVSNPTSTAGNPTPAVDGTNPAVGGTNPAVDGPTPAVDGLNPAVGGPTPVLGGTTPQALTPAALLLPGGLPLVVVLPISVLAGLGAALLLLRRSVKRLGGITGDVLGALVETATTAALITTAVLV